MDICICDDERNLRTSLRNVLETELQLQGIAYTIREFDSGETLLKGLKEKEADILFLDIEMKGISGMDAARRLRESYRDTVIIFVTAYPDYVFQGYEVHAFHYILKPYREEKIREVLRMALEETHRSTEQYYIVEQKSGMLRLLLKDILYFKSDRKKVTAVTKNGAEEFYGKLNDVDSELSGHFTRIHNRYLVNTASVSRLTPTSCICGDEELPVSRAYRQELAVAFARMMLT